MTDRATRGHGVGIEVTSTLIRGVRLAPDRDGRIVAAAEFPVESDDDALLDGLVLLRAELGEPTEATRLATFPSGTTMQRIDVTGRAESEVSELRAQMRSEHSIGSSLIADDGPRRWMLLIRWDEAAIARLVDLARRAGFADVAIEPSAVSVGRVAGVEATFARRLVAQGDAHLAVLSNRLPVAALSTSATGRTHPDLDVSTREIPLAAFDRLLDDLTLGETVDRIAARIPATPGSAAGSAEQPALDLAGTGAVVYPDHDVRSPRRQVVALGAAVGAADLVGPIRPLQMVGPSRGIGGDPFDRPWAIEMLAADADRAADDDTNGIERVTRRFWRRRSG